MYLPRGNGWYDWHTGEWYDGGQQVVLAAPLERTPLLARLVVLVAGNDVKNFNTHNREGSLVPLQGLQGRRVHVFPHRGDGQSSFDLFEDDGYSANAAHQVIQLTMRCTAEAIHLGASATVEWVLPQHEKRMVHRE